MLEQLKEEVCQANLDLVASGLVIQTWGNVSGVDREAGMMVIKPSGVPYDGMRPDQMVVVDLATGQAVEGDLRPSSDTPTHRVLYQAFAGVGGIVHTHSTYATAWAQACRPVPVMGTTHADYFNGPIPCTRQLQPGEIAGDYEANTGKVIVERFAAIDPLEVPGALVAVHGPFAWGTTPAQAVTSAILLEHVAMLASETLRIAGYPQRFQDDLLARHYKRKHGPKATYGQG